MSAGRPDHAFTDAMYRPANRVHRRRAQPNDCCTWQAISLDSVSDSAKTSPVVPTRGVRRGTASDHMTNPPSVPRARWVHYAAGLWAAIFAAPHTWWALGLPFGFPGGPANHRLMMTSWWRYIYDVVVILLTILGAFVALALLRRSGHARTLRTFRVMAWTAGVILSVRGIAGMVVDGTSDPVWWPTFLVGGLLFGSVAWLSPTPRR